MGNVNELHEQEPEPSDGADSSSSEGNSSFNSLAMSEQHTFELPEGVHFKLVESAMTVNLEERPTCSKHPEVCGDLVDNEPVANSIEDSINNTSNDSFPLSESALPTSFDLLEEISLTRSDNSDVFLTPDISQDELETRGTSTQNRPLFDTDNMLQSKSELTENIKLQDTALVDGQQIDYSEDDSSKKVLTKEYVCFHAKPQECKSEIEANEINNQTTVQERSMNEDICDFSILEDSSIPDSSISIILDDSGQTSFDPSKSESGMTSLAEHFNAISLEEPNTSAIEFKAFSDSVEKESPHIFPDASYNVIPLVAEDISLLCSLPESPPAQTLAENQRISDGPQQQPGKFLLEREPTSRAPSFPHGGHHESTFEGPCDQATVMIDDIPSIIPADVQPVSSMAEDVFPLQDAPLSIREPPCARKIEEAQTLSLKTPSLAIDAVSQSKHTADRPNWALAPDSPPKALTASPGKRRKQCPRRGKQVVNESIPGSPGLFSPSSPQKGPQASKSLRRGHEPIPEVKPKTSVSFVPGDTAENKSSLNGLSGKLSSTSLKEYSTSPGRFDCPPGPHLMIESSNSHLPIDIVAQVTIPEIPESSGSSNMSQLPSVHQSLFPQFKQLHCVDQSSKNGVNRTLQTRNRAETTYRHSSASDYGDERVAYLNATARTTGLSLKDISAPFPTSSGVIGDHVHSSHLSMSTEVAQTQGRPIYRSPSSSWESSMALATLKDGNATPNHIAKKTSNIFHEVSPEPDAQAAATMSSAGSSSGVQSKNPGIELRPDSVSPQHSLVPNISSLSSVLSQASGQTLPPRIPPWPSLEEELRFHATNRPLQPSVHKTGKPASQDHSKLLPLVHSNPLVEDHTTHLAHVNGSGGLVAVTKTRHVVFEESTEVGEDTVRVNLPSKRSKSLDPEANSQYVTSRAPRPPFHSGIPIPTNGQFHRESVKNQGKESIFLPRAPRLSAPEDRVVHNFQGVNSRDTSLGNALTQRNRTVSQPFIIRQPIVTPGHPRGPMPTIPANRNPSFLSEARHKPGVPVGRHPDRPCPNVGTPIYLYPAAVISVQEGHFQHNPLYGPHYDSLSSGKNLTTAERGGYGGAGGAGDLGRYHSYGPISFSGTLQHGSEVRDTPMI